MVYGILSKQIKNSKDLGSMISDSLGSMGSFILIVFFAAQLLAFLQWSNLGIIVSVYGQITSTSKWYRTYHRHHYS